MSTFLLPDGLCHQLDRAFKKICGDFQMTNLEISPSNPGSLCVYLRIKVIWVFVLCKMLIFLLSLNLAGSYYQIMIVFGFLSSGRSILNMVIYYLLLFLLDPRFGMALDLLCLFSLLVLVLFLILILSFLFGILLGFLLY
jgi:hypothetical protein